MKNKIHLSNIYTHSEDIVFRDIEGEMVIVPFTEGIGKIDEAIYSLNETGREVWNLLSEDLFLGEIIDQLSLTYNVPVKLIKDDVIELMEDLLEKGFIAEKKR